LLERATMEDVAAAAGVSPKTVSRVINLEPGVAAATVTRVHNAIAELGYRRNDLARNLRKGISLSSIGLVVESLANPLYAVAAQAVDEVALRNGREILLTSSGGDPARERQLVSDLLRHGVEGLLIVPTADDYLFLEPDIRLGVRIVFMYQGTDTIGADVVSIDNAGASRRAVEHLTDYGHKRIAFIRNQTSFVSATGRCQGYRDAMSAAGLPVDETLVRAVPARAESAQAAVRRLMADADPPSAILSENSSLSIGAVRAIRESSNRTALVGFDDFELADVLGISVVACDPGEVGRVAAELLFARLAGDSRPPQRIDVATRLLARGSGEVLAV
jgi:LacI family transcriptional regulator